jgi:hypothetical protein
VVLDFKLEIFFVGVRFVGSKLVILFVGVVKADFEILSLVA